MPDSGQKTLPLMHKLKALAGIVEPKRETESEIHGYPMDKHSTIICYSADSWCLAASSCAHTYKQHVLFCLCAC